MWGAQQHPPACGDGAVQGADTVWGCCGAGGPCCGVAVGLGCGPYGDGDGDWAVRVAEPHLCVGGDGCGAIGCRGGACRGAGGRLGRVMWGSGGLEAGGGSTWGHVAADGAMCWAPMWLECLQGAGRGTGRCTPVQRLRVAGAWGAGSGCWLRGERGAGQRRPGSARLLPKMAALPRPQRGSERGRGRWTRPGPRGAGALRPVGLGGWGPRRAEPGHRQSRVRLPAHVGPCGDEAPSPCRGGG